jgi:hypothetical protein
VKRAVVVASFVALLGAAGPPHGVVTIPPTNEAGYAFKPGPGFTETSTHCLTCHSAAYVITQPVLSKDQWQGEVTKMRAVYGAKIPDDAIPAIVDYLTTQYGKP